MLTRLTIRLGRRRTLQLGSAVVLLLVVALAALVWRMQPRPERSWAVDRAPRQLIVSADARTLLAVDDRSVRLYDGAAQTERAGIPYVWDFPNRSGERNVALSPDGRTVALRNDSQEVPRIQLWRPDVAAVPQPLPDSLDIIGFTADSRTLVVWGDGRYMLWDTVKGEEQPLPAGMGQSVIFFQPMADGRILALEAREGDGWFAAEAWLVVWDVTARQPLSALVGDLGPATVSPDGKAAAARSPRGVHLFETQSGRHLALLPLSDQASDNPTLAFSPDGRRLLVEDREWRQSDAQIGGLAIPVIHVWDVAAAPPRKLGMLREDDYAFSPDGRWLASYAVADGTLRAPSEIVDAETLAVRGKWIDPLALDAVYGPDGCTFASLGMDSQPGSLLLEWLLPMRTPAPAHWYVNFWSLPRGERLLSITGASAVGYFPDGRTVAVGRESGRIEIWRMPPQRSWFVTLTAPLLVLALVIVGGWFVLQFLRLPAPEPQPAGNPEPHSGQ